MGQTLAGVRNRTLRLVFGGLLAVYRVANRRKPIAEPSVELRALGDVLSLLSSGPPKRDARKIRELFHSVYTLGLFRRWNDWVSPRMVTYGGVHCEYITHHSLKAAKGTVIYLHGGGYTSGTMYAYRGWCNQLSLKCNCNVVLVDYTLVPKGSLRDGLHDILTVYTQISEDAAAGNIVVAGDSAGAGYALGLLQQVTALKLRKPAAAVLLSPWADLTLGVGPHDSMNKHNSDIFFPYRVIFESLVDGALEVADGRGAADPENSFLFGSFQGLPPLLITVGEPERLLDDSVRIIQKAEEAQVEVESEILKHGAHDYPILGYSLQIPEFVESTNRVFVYISKHLNGSSRL